MGIGLERFRQRTQRASEARATSSPNEAASPLVPSSPLREPVSETQIQPKTGAQPGLEASATMLAAMQWLAIRLQRPRRIADIYAEWCGGRQGRLKNGLPRWLGGRDGDGGHYVQDLCHARFRLQVEVYEGTDGMFWWRLPTPAPKSDDQHSDPLAARVYQLFAQPPQAKSPLSVPDPQRWFLSRPLGQEDNLQPWSAWALFTEWLLKHHRDQYMSIREAEDAVSALEQQGAIVGADYQAACRTLLERFEAARKLARRERVKIRLS